MIRDKKRHPEDYDLAAKIAASSQFSAYLRTGPHQKFVERGFTDYDSARARADELEAKHSKFGRGALVYAITDQGYSIPVDDDLIELARSL